MGDSRMAVLRVLKGAPVSVLLALLVIPGSAGPVELARWTGYSRRTVGAGLRVLEDLGMVQRHGYHGGWLASSRGRQLVLGETGKNLPSAGSSSSSSYIGEDRFLPETTTTTGSTGKNLPSGAPKLPAAWAAVVDDVLSGHCGMGWARAWEVVGAVRGRGESPGWIGYHGLLWLAYCSDPERSTINNVPAFVASRLESGARVPRGYRPADGFGQWSKVLAYKRQWNEERAGWKGF